MAQIKSGHGSTLAFGTTTTFTPAYTSIGGLNLTRPSLDATVLASDGVRPMLGGDLFSLGPVSAPFLYDQSEMATGADCSLEDLLFDSGAVSADETATLTLANSEASTYAALAHVTGFEQAELVTDQLWSATLSIQFNVMPTFTE